MCWSHRGGVAERAVLRWQLSPSYKREKQNKKNVSHRTKQHSFLSRAILAPTGIGLPFTLYFDSVCGV